MEYHATARTLGVWYRLLLKTKIILSFFPFFLFFFFFFLLRAHSRFSSLEPIFSLAMETLRCCCTAKFNKLHSSGLPAWHKENTLGQPSSNASKKTEKKTSPSIRDNRFSCLSLDYQITASPGTVALVMLWMSLVSLSMKQEQNSECCVFVQNPRHVRSRVSGSEVALVSLARETAKRTTREIQSSKKYVLLLFH